MSLIHRLQPQHRVFAAFALYSFALGNFFPRLPDVKRAMGIEEGALGLALIGTPVGALIALTFAAPVIAKLGHRVALFVLIPLVALFLAIAISAQGPLALFILLIPAGLTIGATEIIVNIEADRTEATIGRRIMNRSHAFWSFGFFAAGLSGAVMAQFAVPPSIHLGLMVPLVIALTLVLLRDFQPAAKRGSDQVVDGPTIAMPSMSILALVGISLCAMLLEGAAIDWSAIYMRTVFDAVPFLGGIAIAAFAFSQAIARYFADRVVDIYGPVRVAKGMQAMMAAGIIVVFIAPDAVAALFGFALLGVGTSALFPLAMSAAAQRNDKPAAINVAALAQFAFVAFLIGPPLLGFVAEHAGLRWAFGVGLPFVALSFLLVGALAPTREKRT